VNLSERRSAHLLFGEELALGEIEPAAYDIAEVAVAVRDRPVPSKLSRVLQRVAVKRGSLTYAAASAAPMIAARSAVLGAAAPGPPRLLVRVDGFPHAQAWDDPARVGTERYRRFHEILREYEIPYLLAVLPHIPRQHLDPAASDWRHLDGDELALLSQLRDDGVAFALHGLDHRTVTTDPRRHSELAGREPEELIERLDRAGAALGQHGILPDVFVAPFDRFEAGQYRLLAERFAVVCGGPQSVPLIGWHPTPLWRGGAVYLPSYAPLYDHAGPISAAVRRLAEQQAALWVPIVLHWDWEADTGWDDLIALCGAMRGLARPWDEFLAAVRASATASPTASR
jgi:peptidoglycan/xylan/chitin deacetylase (PgdA/CDA1 family)